MSRELEFRVLGAVDVVANGESVVPKSARQRDLLALLLLHANITVSSDRLIDRLWQGEPPATASAALQVYVAKLRGVIAECPTATITTVGGGYRFDVDIATIDSHQFEQLAGRGRSALLAGSLRTAVETLQPALELWRGEPLADVRHLEGVLVEVTRLEEMRLQASGTLIDAELGLGRHLEMIPELERLVQEDPLQERRWAQLMLALYRAERQSDALRAYRRAAEILGEELGIEPGPDLYNLEERILLQDPTLSPTEEETTPPTNLERVVTSFVGRERELGRLAELLRARPLITLTGPGGAGKTRMAREVGEQVLASYSDGVWFVDLASVRGGSEVPYRIAETLGVAEQLDLPILDVVSRHLHHRSLLLILDNCEHLVDEVAELVGSLLAACPLLTILATSRERLGVEGETTWTVPPLAFPEHGSVVVSPGEHEAVDLFVERARLVDPAFELTAANGLSVAGICRRLDGLPLAIELAAARVGMLSLAEIEERLAADLSLLSRRSRFQPMRHATLTAAVRWSYELLDDEERALFSRLAVFSGRFLLADAEAVCSDDRLPGPRVFDVLTRLVEKSLVVAHTTEKSGTRYSMLETLRAFAGDIEAGEADAMAERHANHFLVLAEEAGRELQGARQWEWLDRLDADHDNLRAAFDWLVVNERVEAALRMGAALLWFWKMHDNIAEGTARLTRGLAAGGEVSAAVRAEALTAAAVLTSSSDVDAAYGMLEESRSLAASADDRLGAGLALGWMGLLDRIRGQLEVSRDHLTEALELVEDAGGDWATSFVLGHLGVLAREQGLLEAAVDYHERALVISRKIGNVQDEAWNVAALGVIHLYQGRYQQAREFLERSHEAQSDLGFDFELATVSILLAVSSARSGDPDAASPILARAHQRARHLRSARLLDAVYRARATVAGSRGDGKRATQMLGAAHRFSEENGLSRSMFQAFFDADAQLIRSMLSSDEFAAAWDSGRLVDLHDSIAS
jgi:predicted ATPase/DNA-binding SARP family transcriptional activator